jgi:hypothetical protein
MPLLEHVEILTLLLGAAVFGFALFERRRLLAAPGGRLLLVAYALLLASWTASVVEHLVLPTVLEWVQHLTATAAAATLVVWALQGSGSSQEVER